ncbi:hypothetical protein DL546_009799 [Coniochaeta pulveracea]|uniref:Uncharacterized protein n=1 Tax=Coniochaeta pulveracea TaxID=177199 RepID=A0A420YP62_9PEZI|nr:hypothetical protein DL546_009799 [Coniochaeta pulveracea]
MKWSMSLPFFWGTLGLAAANNYFDSNPVRVWPKEQTERTYDMPTVDSVCEEFPGTNARPRKPFSEKQSIVYDQWPVVVCRPRTERIVGDYFGMTSVTDRFFCHPERHYYACASFDDTPAHKKKGKGLHKRLLPQTRFDWHDHEREISCHEYTSLVPRTRQVLTCEPIDVRPTAKHREMVPWKVKGRFGWYECRWLAHVEVFACPYYNESPENKVDDLPDRYPDVDDKTPAGIAKTMKEIENQRNHGLEFHKIPSLRRRAFISDALKGAMAGYIKSDKAKVAYLNPESDPLKAAFAAADAADAALPPPPPPPPPKPKPTKPYHLDNPVETLIISDGPVPDEVRKNVQYINPFPQGRKFAQWESYAVGQRALMFCQPDPVYPDRDDLEMCSVGQEANGDIAEYLYAPWLHVYDNGETWWCKPRGRVNDCSRVGPARLPPRKQVWERLCPKNGGGGRVEVRTVERTVVSTVYATVTAQVAVPTGAVRQGC